MTEQQFTVLAGLLGLSESDRAAARYVILDGGAGAAAGIVERLKEADSRIRGAYVIHGPMEFRIVVGHRDVHRMPGALKLEVGDLVRLTAHATERWVPVRVTALPDSPPGYYSGVILEQMVSGSRYQAGNGVRFSEDQVMMDAPRALAGRKTA